MARRTALGSISSTRAASITVSIVPGIMSPRTSASRTADHHDNALACNTQQGNFPNYSNKMLNKIHDRVYSEGVERPHGNVGKQSPWGHKDTGA